MRAEQNYIYIVFVILYIIYSIVKAGKNAVKQKPASASPPAEQAQPEDVFKKLLEGVLGRTLPGKIPSSKVLPPKPDEAKRMPSKITIHTPSKERTASLKAKSPLSKHDAPDVKISPAPAAAAPATLFYQSRIENADTFNEAEDFDIRQAVIYSEILKRPTW